MWMTRTCVTMSTPDSLPGAFDEGDEPSIRIGVAHAPYMRTLHRFVQDGAQAILPAIHTAVRSAYPAVMPWSATAICRLRAKGVSEQSGIPVQVSAGLGTSRFAPVRLFCPPEAILVTLTARDRG